MYSKKIISLFLFLLIQLAAFSSASQDALLNFNIDDSLPSIKLPLVQNDSIVEFKTKSGKPSVIMFMGLSPAFRGKRSLNLADAISKVKNNFTDRVNFAAVYSEDKELATLRDYVKDGLFNFPVLDDSQKKIYERYGIFMLPLAIIVNAEGKLHAVVPYTYTIEEILSNNLKLLLGDLSKDEFLESIKVKANISKTKEEKEYIRRVNYGRVMMARKIYPAAMREFQTAFKIMPEALEALIGIGQVQLATNEFQQAESTFRKALKIDKENDESIAGLGIALYKSGKIEEALIELENAFISKDQKIEVIIALAEIYEKKGNLTKSVRLNKLAVTKLLSRFE